MNNQSLRKIGIGVDGHNTTKLNLKRNVNSTMQWGDLEPLMCELMLPHQKLKVKSESLTRLSPVVLPCFGDIHYKTVSMFCPIEELMPTFNAMMAGQPYSNGTTTFLPTSVPVAETCVLSLLPLIGSTISVWTSEESFVGGLSTITEWKRHHPSSTKGQDIRTFFGPKLLYNTTSSWSSSSIRHFDARWLLGGSGNSVYLPAANEYLDRLTDSVYASITPSTADTVLYLTVSKSDIPSQELDSQVYAICFRYSDLGKRYYKLLRGLGYNIDLSDYRKVSMLPLMAYWRVYFECYGVRHFKNFEQTNLFKLSSYLRTSSAYEVTRASSTFTNVAGMWWSFMRDLGQMWYTDPVDWVSSHQARVLEGFGAKDFLGNEPALSFANTGFIDVSRSTVGNIFTSGDTSSSPLNSHAYYNGTGHGALDDKLLKILYKWSNRQDIIGGDIKEQLKAMGQGNVDDEIPVSFIGATDVEVPIHDVSAFADTYNSTDDSGKMLGEFAGKGVAHDEGKVFTWKADKYGYWVTMAVIVPESSYCQQSDGRLRCVNRFSFYQPEFDGLGMEATPISDIISCPPGVVRLGSDGISSDLSQTFGYTPRSSMFKVSRDVINGEFAMNSKMDNFSPYHLDKVMHLGRVVVGAPSTSGTITTVKVVSGGNFFDVSQLPKAGTWWRFNSRYKWMANFNRIFADSGNFQNNSIYGSASAWSETTGDYVDMVFRNDDNFIVHNVIYVDSESPVKPIALSFETFDDDKGANGDVVKS